MTKEDNNIIGWKSVFANYTIFDALKDCKYPVCISIFLTIIIVINSSDFLISLEKIVSIIEEYKFVLCGNNTYHGYCPDIYFFT